MRREVANANSGVCAAVAIPLALLTQRSADCTQTKKQMVGQFPVSALTRSWALVFATRLHAVSVRSEN